MEKKLQNNSLERINLILREIQENEEALYSFEVQKYFIMWESNTELVEMCVGQSAIAGAD